MGFFDKFKRYDMYFIIYDILIYILICIVTFLLHIDAINTKSFNSVLISILIVMLILPCLIYIVALYYNKSFKAFGDKAEVEKTYLHQFISLDNIRYVNGTYKLIFPSKFKRFCFKLLPHWNIYSPYEFLHKIDLDKIIDKDDPDNDSKNIKNPWTEFIDISNTKQVIKTIKDINFYKLVGSIIFILPAIIFLVLNLYCIIEKKIDTKPCGNANEEDDDNDDSPCNQSDGECQENTESFVESMNNQSQSESEPQPEPEPEDKDEPKSKNNKPSVFKPFIFSLIAIICNILFVVIKIQWPDNIEEPVEEAKNDLKAIEFSFFNIVKNPKNLFILIFFNSLTKIPSIGEELYDVYGKYEPSEIINKVIESENITDIEVTTNKDNKFDKYDKIIKKIGELKDNYFLDVVYEIKDISERKLAGIGGQASPHQQSGAEDMKVRDAAVAVAAEAEKGNAVARKIENESVSNGQSIMPPVLGVAAPQPSVPILQGTVVSPNPQLQPSVPILQGTVVSPNPQSQPQMQSQMQPQMQPQMEQVPMGQVPMGLVLPDQQSQLTKQVGGDNGKKNSLKDSIITSIGVGAADKLLKASKSKRAQEAKDQIEYIASNMDPSGRDKIQTGKAGIVNTIIASNDKKSDMPAQQPAAARDPVAAPASPPQPVLGSHPKRKLKRQSRQDLTPNLPASTTAKAQTSASVDESRPESESDVTKFLQYFGVNTDNDTNTVYFEDLKQFEKNLILYKYDILKKSLLYKIHDIYQGNDILSSFNLWAKMYIFERRSGVKSKTKQTMINFSELLGKYIYILIKLVIVMWILYILFKSKKPNNFLNVTFKIFIVYYLIFTFIREKEILFELRNAFFRGI